jgi:hypothetical protein
LTSDETLEMSSCDHEEADTRLIVHIVDALSKGRNTCLVRTVDTDVVVILIGKFYYFTTLNSNANIWVAFGSGKNFAFWHINTICHSLGEERSLALPFFHSYTGCDTTSFFFRRGKRLAWDAWKCFPDVSTRVALILIPLLQIFNLPSSGKIYCNLVQQEQQHCIC